MNPCKCGCGTPVRRSFATGHHRRKSLAEWIEQDRGFDTPCWVWQRAIQSQGYGASQGRAAHRVVYERLVGAIPEGLELDHLCRVTACVNPAHLEPVTHSENMRRGRVAKKIGREDADVIKGLRGQVTGQFLADWFGITPAAVSAIHHGKAWA